MSEKDNVITALIVIAIATILGACLWLTLSGNVHINKESNNQEIGVDSKEIEQSTLEYKQPLDEEMSTEGENAIGSKTFTNEGNRIEFVFDSAIPGGAQNDPYDIVLNGKTLESILAAKASAQEKFSDDGRYFAYRERGVCGAGCFFYVLVLVDIEEERVSTIPLKHTQNETVLEVPGELRMGEVIESFEFSGEKIRYISFLTVSNEERYRATPKEVWEYDLVTGENSLIKTLED